MIVAMIVLMMVVIMMMILRNVFAPSAAHKIVPWDLGPPGPLAGRQFKHGHLMISNNIKINSLSFPPFNSELTARVVETGNDVER